MARKKQKENDTRDGTTKRLDAIIRLMMDRQQDPSMKVTKFDQVQSLRSTGLSDTEIGNIVGYERKNVAAMFTKAKKRNSVKKR